MRITREGGLIIVRDQTGPYWFLVLFLLSGGALGIAAPLGLANNAGQLEPWERLTSLAIGIGVSLGALWWMAQNPSTRLELDLTRRLLTLVRLGVNGREVRQFSFNELAAVELVQGKDSDGDPIWRPAARLQSGELVLLSELWSHDKEGVLAGVAAVADSCRLPFSPHVARNKQE
jgi:hypothetical protein